MVKTDNYVSKNGKVSIQTVNRGKALDGWLTLLRARRYIDVDSVSCRR